MENCQLILNSNSLCLFCLSEVKVKACKNDLFPLHHLTSKINISLGNVFHDVTVPWAPLPVLERMEVVVDACEGCVHLCEDFLYKYQEDVEWENCVKSILGEMGKVELTEAYNNCRSPLAVVHLGIVDRLRMEIIQKQKSNESEAKTSEEPVSFKTLLHIPHLPISKICSYLSHEEIKNFSIVSKDLRPLVFPSLVNASVIRFDRRSQIPALISLIKANYNEGKNLFNLFIKSESVDDSPDSQADLLNLFRECGAHISHLKLSFGCANSRREEIPNGFLNNNSIPVLESGNELFPSLKKLELDFDGYGIEWADGEDTVYIEDLLEASLPFIKAIFRKASKLKELKLDGGAYVPISSNLYELIGGLPINTLEVYRLNIIEEDFAHLQSLNLTKLVLHADLCSMEDSQALTGFLESQKTSLKYFEFKADDNVDMPHFTFPHMESLQTYKLHISGKGEIKNGENLPPIAFNTQLPKLESIELVVGKDDLQVLFATDAEPTTSVQELRLEMTSVWEDSLRSALIFKCLSKLEIPVDSHLKDCWKELSGLEGLTLHSVGENLSWEKITWIDEAITGLSISQRYWKVITDEDIQKYDEKYEEMEPKKSLALLKGLRLLRIRHGGKYIHGQRLMLSDISCRVVLMKMDSLKCIDFCGIHPSFVGASRKVLNEMGKKMDLYFGEIRDWHY